jgi:preprotein translocase subunit SecF
MRNYYEWHKKEIWIGGVIVFMLIVCVVGIYLNSSSLVSTPKADEFGRQSAEAHTESVAKEAEADAIAEQIEQVEGERQKQKQRVESSRSRLQTSRDKLNKSKENYEKVVSQPVAVSDDDLDARERKLYADLKRIYWSQ